MMKAKISPNLISFVTVRRGEWMVKVSVYKNKNIMVVAWNEYDYTVLVKDFIDQNLAANFIEQLVI